MISTNLTIIILIITINSLIKVNCQRWDLCQTETKGVFCLGSQGGVTYSKAGGQCFIDNDCDVFVAADARPVDYGVRANNMITWSFYQATPTPPAGSNLVYVTSFFVHQNLSTLATGQEYPEDVMFAYMCNRRPTMYPDPQPTNNGAFKPSGMPVVELTVATGAIISFINQTTSINANVYLFQSKATLFYPETAPVITYAAALLDEPLYATIVHRQISLDANDGYLSALKEIKVDTETRRLLFDIDLAAGGPGPATLPPVVPVVPGVTTTPEAKDDASGMSNTVIIAIPVLVVLIIIVVLWLMFVKKKKKLNVRPEKGIDESTGNQFMATAPRESVDGMDEVKSQMDDPSTQGGSDEQISQYGNAPEN